jgi:predicted Zn-dependent peptidase
MRTLLVLIALWATLLSNIFGASESNVTDPYRAIDYFKLENGLQVYLLPDTQAAKTTVSMTVKVGYDIEEDATYGISHLVEHLVFRDRRVPHFDYLDYMQEKGATDINGYTRRYETGYYATIESAKSYWIVETFAKMLFDKNVTEEDLEVEKGALQTEIGEPRWYYAPLWHLGHFLFDVLMPPDEDIYRDEFSLKKRHELPAGYLSRENNRRFTLPEVLEHYEKYYYPANMILTVTGNFSADKMKRLIREHYGKVEKSGHLSAKEPDQKPTLNHKPYRRYFEGSSENSGYIGTKYLIDDYRKYLILDIYSDNLAQRLQHRLRNRLGKTYSISSYGFSDRGAGVQTIAFDGLHDHFSDTIEEVDAAIERDLTDLNDTTIREALAYYEKQYYTAIEHDSDSLAGLVSTARYLREEHNITNRSSYALFRSITPDLFRKTIQEAFAPENRYHYITRDYHYFPLEMPVLSLVTLFLFFFAYFKLFTWDRKKYGITYTQRDIILQRRVSSRFFGFSILVMMMFLSMILWEWFKYLLFKILFADPYYLQTIDVPWSYLATLLDPLCYVTLTIVLYRLLWRYYARIDVTRDTLYAVGNRILAIPRESIASIGIADWREAKRAWTIGDVFRFWKPLVRLTLKDGKTYYLRSTNAEHLREDLERWWKTHEATVVNQPL